MIDEFGTGSEGFEELLGTSQGSPTEPIEPTEPKEPTTPTEEVIAEPITKPAEPQEPEKNSAEKSDDYIVQFLDGFGLSNGKVTYESEDGSIEEVSFNDLDTEEKLNILREITAPNLSEAEINTINYLRRNNATIQDVIEYYSNKAVQDYIDQNGTVEKKYSVDEYSDDELYVAYLKSKFPDMSEEDISSEVEMSKTNEDLHKRKLEIIRNQYKTQEEDERKQKMAEQEEQYNTYVSTLQDCIAKFEEFSMDYKDKESDSIVIEDAEKSQIYDYIMNQDENGQSQLYKDLNTPEKLVEMAWFSMFGKDIISDISKY